MRRLCLPLVSALVLVAAAPWLAACQDAAASNPARDTHMGEVRAAAEPWPALPPAPSGAVPVPLSAAAPSLVAIQPAPTPPPPPPGLAAPGASSGAAHPAAAHPMVSPHAVPPTH
jgi:hypothetical protein